MPNQEQKLREPAVMPAIQLNGYALTINSQAINVIEVDVNGNVNRCFGTVVVTDGGSGYAKGCIYVKTDAVSGTDGLYENVGTSTSCQFLQADAVTPGEIALANSHIIVGNGSGVGADVALSGDATISNTGALTLASGLIYQTSTVVASAGVNALHSAPVTIVQAPAANQLIELISVYLEYIFGGTPFTVTNVGDLALKYGSAAGVTATAVLAATGLIDQSATQNRLWKLTTANVTPATATAVVFYANGVNPSAGTGSVVVQATYRIITVT